MGSAITHVEIQSQQQTKLIGFYEELFGWSADTNNPMGYAMMDTKAGTGVSAG